MEKKKTKFRSNKEKAVHGVGTNDADYHVEVKGVFCPYYLKWKTMLARCYTKRYQAHNKTYVGTFVCDEWLTFSNFKSWMEQQDWEGKHLDKDLLGNGKIYSPETCCFLPPKVNYFLTANPSGKYMYGVNKSYNKYLSRITNPITGKRFIIGTFNCEMAAHIAYKIKKLEYAKALAVGLEPRLAEALIERHKR